MHAPLSLATILFTDVEGSTALWEQHPLQMRAALEQHDAVVRRVIESHRGSVIKLTGDGVYAAFADAVDAIRATVQLQITLADPTGGHDLPLLVRCGLHTGTIERRDDDYFGADVNRGARIMSAAYGGQVIASQSVADSTCSRLPQDVTLRDLGFVRLRSLTKPEHVYQVLHQGLRQDFPALRSMESTPNNLPKPMSTFIGPERARLRSEP